MKSKKPEMIVIIVLALVLLGWIGVQAILHRNYEAKPKVFNMLGLNPTTYWKTKQAPDFKLKEMHTGKLVQLSQFRGKVVLLDFWASWCHSCQKQLRVLQSLHNDPTLRNRLQILSINMKESIPPAAVTAFVRKQGYTFPVLFGTEDVVKTYKIWFFPVMVLISPTGKILYTGAEFHSEASVRKLMQAAITG